MCSGGSSSPFSLLVHRVSGLWFTIRIYVASLRAYAEGSNQTVTRPTHSKKSQSGKKTTHPYLFLQPSLSHSTTSFSAQRAVMNLSSLTKFYTTIIRHITFSSRKETIKDNHPDDCQLSDNKVDERPKGKKCSTFSKLISIFFGSLNLFFKLLIM